MCYGTELTSNPCPQGAARKGGMDRHSSGRANAERIYRKRQRSYASRADDETLVMSLAQARVESAAWIENYNRERPNSSYG